MREIDTRVVTYDPIIVNSGYVDDNYDIAIMAVVEDGTGDWVEITEHESIIRALQRRIVVLENCYQDVVNEVTR